jgi:hypothetical protein
MKAVCNLNVALKDYMYAAELNVPPRLSDWGAG